MPETIDRNYEALAHRSRHERGRQRQQARRNRECRARRRAAGLEIPYGEQQHVAQSLGVASRTIRHWSCLERRGVLLPRPLGRPCHEATHAEKLQALRVLDEQGPHLGLPSLRACLPKIPRCQWQDLQRDYRAWWQQHHPHLLQVDPRDT